MNLTHKQKTWLLKLVRVLLERLDSTILDLKCHGEFNMASKLEDIQESIYRIIDKLEHALEVCID
jgi:hypothetical protein